MDKGGKVTSLIEDLIKEFSGFPIDKINWENLDLALQNMLVEVRKVELTLPNGLKVDLDKSNRVSKHFWKLLDDILVGNNPWLVGQKGTGKTFLAEQIGAALDRKVLTINCNQWTSPRELKGGETIEGYKEGILIECWEKGYILLLDELPKIDPNTAGILNEALAKSAAVGAKSRLTTGEGRVIEKHPDFACIATGNTNGRTASAAYGGNNVQDLSLLDRFAGSFYYIEFDRELEINNIFTKVFEIFDQLRDILIAEEYEDIPTLRVMSNCNRIFVLEMERSLGNVKYSEGQQEGKTLKDCIESYLEGMDEDVKRVVKEKIDFTTFYNSYKDLTVYKSDKADFESKRYRSVPKSYKK